MSIDDVGNSLLVSQILNVGLEEDFNEGNCHAEDKPNINHFDIAGLCQGVGDSDIPSDKYFRSQMHINLVHYSDIVIKTS